MLIPYENLTSKTHDINNTTLEALKDLEEGWVRRNYSPVNLRKNINWKLESEEERSWNFHIHSWDMLENLLMASSFKLYAVFLEPAIKIALDWCDKNIKNGSEPSDELSKFAWYDMAVGLRAYRLAYIIDAAKNLGILSKDDESKLWSALMIHHSYLMNDENIAFHTNHGYYQASGQIAMGRRFKEVSSEMALALETGISRFHIMLNQQFTESGVHREHSPDYHRMVYDTLIGVINAGLIEDNDLIEYTKKIEEALSWFVLPNQRLLNFGDSDWRSVARKPKIAKAKWQTSAMQFVVTNGEIGSLPKDTLKVFEKGGYYIARFNQKEDSGKYDTYSYLAQTAAFHSRTHKHADDLSFIWYEKGHNILIDAGRYGYIGKAEMGTELWKQGYWYTHPNRLYCESTRAHNTLEFDEENYPRKGIKPYGSAIGRHKQYDNGLTILETECKHFKSIRRVRVLIYMPNQWLIVYDWFKDNLDNKHDVRQWFNFAPEVKLMKRDNGYFTQLDDSTELHITNLLEKVTASKIAHGVEEPRLQGWFSPAEREFVPIDSINYKLESSVTGSVATLFSFNGLPSFNIKENQVSVSGRSLICSWSDEIGKHNLVLNRKMDQDLKVDYQVNALSIGK